MAQEGRPVGNAHPPRDVGDPLMLTYEEASLKLGVSRTHLYELMRDGEIRSLKLGPQVRRIPLTELEDWLKRQEAEQWGTDANPSEAA
jgi:excisionase family DNA binding protein